ncbi:MAG: NYN domain-containing protein [Gloeomargarita sp. SKYBB_i_bin120]|nr:NYN domain-containing protein [Gloeomargarita sp. SKYG98]MCS7293338.1 NYN domain-containing protein [Gloeomargarita sp. SKYB120]MDW8178903.1 NYN domain-containing protein [Gloeomargarita sp. SKYBB_i_bin120]
MGLFTPQQVLENRGRIAIFIDGSNLFYAALQLGIEIDYSKLLCYLTGGSRLLRAFFYTGVDPTNEKQQGFLLWMRRNGYRVVCKELVQLPDGSKKANLDVEIAVDMLSLAGFYDTAVLVSGDGDLAYAVDAVSYRGVRVEVVSLRSMTSDNLINVADRYIDLETIRDEIRKAPRPTAYRLVAETANSNATNNSTEPAN